MFRVKMGFFTDDSGVVNETNEDDVSQTEVLEESDMEKYL